MEPNEVFSIAHFDYGVAIKGELPEMMLSFLSDLYHNRYGFDLVDLDIAEHLNCIIVFTISSKQVKWRQQLGVSIDNLQIDNPSDIPNNK